jgi:DNA-binding NtrC family response regulator
MRQRQTKRILVQDDELSICEIVRHMLSREGYRCATAETAGQTLEILRSSKNIDLVICGNWEWHDEQFEELFGSFPDIPVIVCTAPSDKNVLRRALRLGAYHFLLKPFEDFELFSLVARALEHRNLTLENRSLRSKLKPSTKGRRSQQS